MARRSSPSRPASAAGADHAIVFGRQIWAFAVLVAALAVLTSPLWVFLAPPIIGSRALFIAMALVFWLLLGAVALTAGRDWGSSLILDPPGRTVTRERRGPWSATVAWSYSGDRIERVFLQSDGQGLPRLLGSLWGGGTFLIAAGAGHADLELLGRRLAHCWQVPFHS